MRILIAGDGKFSRHMLASAVTDLGHEFVTANDGAEAWEAVRHGGFDVLITDWEMPGLTGVQLCERVRQAGLDSYLYVILLTARAARDDRYEGLAAGVDDFLTKPFDDAELAARLAVAERILRWAAQLQAVNDLVVEGSRQLAEKAAQIDLLRREAEYMANHDTLTGILNRRAWLTAMAESSGRTFVAMADIDHFKRVNDIYGHQAGDDVLRQVALSLSRGPGIVARFGGEEFAIGFRCPADEARAWCADVLDEIATQVVQTEAGPVTVSLSIGLAVVDGEVDAALRAADSALYDAKRAGRNRVVEWSPAGSAVEKLTPYGTAWARAS